MDHKHPASLQTVSIYIKQGMRYVHSDARTSLNCGDLKCRLAVCV